jgi:hypothetical protein
LVLVGSEHFGDFSNLAFDFLLLFSVFLELDLVGNEVHRVHFLFFAHADLLAHEGAKSSLESREVNEAFALRVQHGVHERHQFGLAVLDLHAGHVR